MNKIILFSPVGGTDPISNYNCKDGALLNICRSYRPDKVYLYMSKEILELHNKDNRYIYCLDKLSEWQKWDYEYEIIERPKLENVQEFNQFYDDFEHILSGIMSDCDESDTLLLNISSGTPAMKSALLILKTLDELSCKAIQVSTPEKRMNEHRHTDYDVETLWDVYKEESSEHFESRCKEVECPSVSLIKQEGIIKKLISEYSYQAAVEAAEMLPKEKTEAYIDLLRMAAARALLDISATDKILLRNSSYKLPIRDAGTRKYFEYALSLQIKLKKHEYADFIRGISPLLADLFERILERQTDIRLKDYCYDRNGSWKWDLEKIDGTKLYAILSQEYRGELKSKDVYSSQLAVLIQNYAKNHEVVDIVTELRNVEARLRNTAAHEIVSITDEIIKKKLGFSGKHIMDMIKKAFIYADFNVKKENWDSYDEMNEVIIRAMK